MSADDRIHWDERYTQRLSDEPTALVRCPAAFVGYEPHFPTVGQGLELACGRGAASVWLAKRGLCMKGLDVSAVAIETAKELAEAHGSADRCHFEVVDLDQTLPRESRYDLVMCHMFRAESLDAAIIERLNPGGLLAIATLSEVGGSSGRFRAEPGALKRDFQALRVVAHVEGDGRAMLLARKP